MKITQQNWSHGGIEAIRQAQAELAELNKTVNTGFTVLTEEEMIAYAAVRANDKVYDVELDDGRSCSVQAVDENDALTKATEFFDSIDNPPPTEVENLKSQVDSLQKVLETKGVLTKADIGAIDAIDAPV